jgi:hypothetical protein
MVEKPNEFDRFSESIRATAIDTGALILDALLDNPDRPSAPSVSLGLDGILSVIRHVRPRVVYLIESCFDLDSDAYDTNVEDEDECSDKEAENSERRPALDKLVRKWRKRDGKPCLAFASFMADGILHTAVSRPDWRDDFDSELEIIKGEIESQRDEEREGLNKRDSQDVREKAEILSNHASFSAGRISFEKRAFLAEHLFPGLKPELISAITRRAENLDWLKKSGFQS